MRKLVDVYQLKVTLTETAPPVWRRLLLPSGVTLKTLHGILQAAMGWEDSHLHCFEFGDRRLGMVGVEEDAEDLEDERRTRLSTLLQRKGDELVYRYDYGDDWEHRVVLESRMPPDERIHYPLCIGGARACPPEDCGGPHAYEDLLRVLASPKDPQHDELLSWVGGYFDPESFDANAVNRSLRVGR
jgi:hypothetical protein